MSKLDRLVGQELKRIEAVHDYHQLHFTHCLLNVFNPMVVEEPPQVGGSGRRVASVRETERVIQMTLSDGTTISIDMARSAWGGPEALALYQGEECLAVWT